MEENKDPFIKTNNDKEIENILNEAPVSTEPEKKIKENNTINKDTIKKEKIISKKTIIIIGGMLLLIISGWFIILPESNEPIICEKDKCVIDVTKTNQNFVDSIKQQIISNGYAEIKDGDKLIRLAPYLG